MQIVQPEMKPLFFLARPVDRGRRVAKKLIDIAQEGLPPGQFTPLAAGIIVSGVLGYLSIAFLIRYLQTHNTFAFIYYRIALGVVVYLAFWSGFR